MGLALGAVRDDEPADARLQERADDALRGAARAKQEDRLAGELEPEMAGQVAHEPDPVGIVAMALIEHEGVDDACGPARARSRICSSRRPHP